MKAPTSAIRLRGARQNNLKSIDLDLPIGELIVVTGLSGAGKSSLVFDCLHAEGNRRYAETFSPYARQFMELLERPKVDSIENIRPSIAIEQGNTVKTSRSTVGTMTEICDYAKVWFAHVAQLHDPDTGEIIELDDPASIWKKTSALYANESLLIAFEIRRPAKVDADTILQSLLAQGYTRIITPTGIVRTEDLAPDSIASGDILHVIQDRLKIASSNRARFLESARNALHFGQGQIQLFTAEGTALCAFSEGLHRPGSQLRFRNATPNLFSFNSPIGACPDCRGFGRVIEIDDNLVIPDRRLSLAEGAIKAFSGAVYSESQRDLIRACKRHRIPTTTPWQDLRPEEQEFVMEGEPGFGEPGKGYQSAWYGVRRFFGWLQENTYKMHVRVFLSRYRSYVTCPTCSGKRLQEESLCWKWRGYTLPDLYELPISELHTLLTAKSVSMDEARAKLALQAMQTRLSYLEAVGLGYLTLNRTSRSLSGGETQRVNLTSCLGTSLVDTLFILDEPSIGLHSRDIDRLIRLLRDLANAGNTVLVVEHDERIMQAADRLIEVGPVPGAQGGHIIYSGKPKGIQRLKKSPTGRFLSGRQAIDPPLTKRAVTQNTPRLRMCRITKHNLCGLDLELPLERFVVLGGVSGSGKSTLLHNAIYQGLLARSGKACEDPAAFASLEVDQGFGEVLLVDQSPVSRTPRSNTALFIGIWDTVRQLFAQTDDARSMSLTPSAFSFNSGDGRCPHCNGLGQERVEMQFMADVYVPCPICEGKQFRPEILQVNWRGHSIAEILQLTVEEAVDCFSEVPAVAHKLKELLSVGLGYLPLGQPLNTLSGGESQRLKLVRYTSSLNGGQHPALLLLDEPTTGLHLADIEMLLKVLQGLVTAGHSLVVIEHHPDVIRCADWFIELGPDAGQQGGRIVYAGIPETVSNTATAPYLDRNHSAKDLTSSKGRRAKPNTALVLKGAREHNLKNISTRLPNGSMTVVTGVSGSGKSTLAFDIIFAEGQRRFMESMSSWARQYVEQLPKPDIDALTGIPPTVAIEQRVTHGTRKSTVATITEVAQYLRLLYARVGTQCSPTTGEPLVALPAAAIIGHLRKRLLALPARAKQQHIDILAPLIRGRKGHHEPLATWARNHGYTHLRIDGEWVHLDNFKKLDRYREHTIDLVVARIQLSSNSTIICISKNSRPTRLEDAVQSALALGKGSFFVAIPKHLDPIWFSTSKSDPISGEAFPDLDPKDFSWNAPRGWCPTCHGYGHLYPWMLEDERFEDIASMDLEDNGTLCPDCSGQRLNPISRAVYISTVSGDRYNLPALLALTPSGLLEVLDAVDTDARGHAILQELLPEIRERLRFMDEVGLGYLGLDRATKTLSGGEAQRIRLAAQLGSNLAGALYVLDEPSIGLHERDNERLLKSLHALKTKGNTLLVVEHDAKTMEAADHIIDLGPGAGINGGRILAEGNVQALTANSKSLTGRYLLNGIAHPSRGSWRALPNPFNPKSKTSREQWMALYGAGLRNLKGFDLFIPKARLVMVCGVSGAGKSTLIRDLLMPAVQQAITANKRSLNGSRQSGFNRLTGANAFRKVIEVDQSPIGKTPRSTPATYIGAFDRIRELFANTPEARMRGFVPGSFSFNTKGGRCESCKGAGRVKLEMNFMPDTYIPCEDCSGGRYGPELEDIQWNGANIAEVLAMPFDKAASFFAFDPQLTDLLSLMVETGLGYLTLGQSSPTLSGGEAQRLKLVSELAAGLPSFKDRRYASFQPNLYILEEPTIGLHMHDCERLIRLLHRLVDQGHSVIVIEHNPDLLMEADYLVEIGPEGGYQGGSLLHQGTVDQLQNIHESPTRPYIRV
jgi:excinuclease ABC subunit A